MTHPSDSIWRRIWTVALGILAGAVATLGTVAVAVAGFALSYDAIRAVGIAAHIRWSWAWLLPVSVDGAMAVATVAAVVLRHVAGRTAVYPWAVVIVGALISVACNGLHATGTLLDNDAVRFAVSAIPPVMLTLSIHLLVVLVEVSYRVATRRDEGQDERVAPVAAPRVSLTKPQVVPAVAVASAEPVSQPDVPAVSLDKGRGEADVVSLSERATATERRATSRHRASRGNDDASIRVARRRVAKGDSCGAVADDLGVSRKTVERWTAEIRAARDSRTAATRDTGADDDQERRLDALNDRLVSVGASS
jgi:hypothetical protein